MTVECPSCGETVQIPSFPGWCPKCNKRITSLVPPLKSKPKSPSSSESSFASDTTGISLSSIQKMDEFAAPERPLPFVERERRPIPWLFWIKIGSAVAALLISFILVYVVVGKVKAMFSAKPAKPAPAPIAVAPTPPPPKPNSIFDENYPPPSAVASTQQPRQQQLPTTEVAPAPAIKVIPPVMPKRIEDANPVTDKTIEAAIHRGSTYVIENVKTGELTPAHLEPTMHREGKFALCVLALLHAGYSTFDERVALSGEMMPMLIDRMKKLPMNEGMATYARGIRAMALSLHNRRADRQALNGDLEWLLKSSVEGKYSYVMPKDDAQRASAHFDNSNAQYGVLGVWAAADAGLSVPQKYWEDVEAHWTKAQAPAGSWGYFMNGGDINLAMTAGGVTSLFVAGDQLATVRITKGVDVAPYKPAQQKGLDWLSTGDNAVNLGGHTGYTLYGLERAGLASGWKRFGKHEWFRELAAGVLGSQQKDGEWTGPDGLLPETCFRVLFLSRGRHPVLLNKLRFDGPWANRPRDAARLADFVFDTIERPVNWQVANLSDGWREWMDAPLLYLASHAPVPLTDANVNDIRSYIQAGGMLFTNADADAKEFNDYVEELAKKLFPQFQMQDLPPEHPVYSMIYRITGDKRPPLRGLSSGTRLLMIHSPTDLAADWQNRHPKVRPIPFQLGANIFVYATGKAPLRNRLDTPVLADVKDAPLATFHVARVRYSGEWDPEPLAWDRMSKWFRHETNIALNIVPTNAIALRRLNTPFAHITATAPWKPSEAELNTFRNFVREGGLLLIDPCGGSYDLAIALQRDIVAAAFPDQQPRDVNETDQFFAGTGAGMDDLSRPLMRVYAVEQLENKAPPMQVLPMGKGWIVISRLDLVSGLLGTNTWGILGYDPNYAQAMMKNLILYACNGRSFDVPPPPAPPKEGERPVSPPPDPGTPGAPTATEPAPAASQRVIQPPPDPGAPVSQ